MRGIKSLGIFNFALFVASWWAKPKLNSTDL
jgi:hypothetical protein